MPENTRPDDEIDTLADLVKQWLVAEQDVRAAEVARVRSIEAIEAWQRRHR